MWFSTGITHHLLVAGHYRGFLLPFRDPSLTFPPSPEKPDSTNHGCYGERFLWASLPWGNERQSCRQSWASTVRFLWLQIWGQEREDFPGREGRKSALIEMLIEWKWSGLKSSSLHLPILRWHNGCSESSHCPKHTDLHSFITWWGGRVPGKDKWEAANYTPLLLLREWWVFNLKFCSSQKEFSIGVQACS